MNLLPLAFIVAAGSHIVLDGTIEVPRHEWRYVDIEAKEPMAVLICEYRVLSENTPVRLVWIARSSLEDFRAGGREKILAATSFDLDGKLRHFAPTTGDYALVIENDPSGAARAKVKVKAWLESAVTPKYASPQRRLAVIILSSIIFFSIVSATAYKLRRAM